MEASLQKFREPVMLSIKSVVPKHPVIQAVRRSFQDRPQILQSVEQMPDIVARPVDAVRMEVGKRRIVAIAFKSLFRSPFDHDHHRARVAPIGFYPPF